MEVLELTRMETLEGHPADLHALLLRYRGRESSDSRDLVYGLLGLIGDASTSLRPDYSLSREEVFRRATLYSIVQTGKLHLLQDRRQLSSDMASWIYDCDCTRLPNQWRLDYQQRTNNRLSAASLNYSVDLDNYSIYTASESTPLSLDGVFVDRVALTLRDTSDPNSAAYTSHWVSLKRWHAAASEYYSDQEKDIYGLDWESAFLRTIVRDTLFTVSELGSPSQRQATNEDLPVIAEAVRGLNEDTLTQNNPANSLRTHMKFSVMDYTFFIIENGYMGLGNPQVGDEI
ncbi:hypothetical protein EG329_003696 [Mollisiaceae sp. DMI_Dod_QoI]|nr:hypothetical protein EG329_003696 [Helotiales sp. DMI_Dod_QoI]